MNPNWRASGALLAGVVQKQAVFGNKGKGFLEIAKDGTAVLIDKQGPGNGDKSRLTNSASSNPKCNFMINNGRGEDAAHMHKILP